MSPNLHSMTEPVCASALTLMTVEEWLESRILNKAGNFVAIDTDKLPLSKARIAAFYKEMTERTKKTFLEKMSKF